MYVSGFVHTCQYLPAFQECQRISVFLLLGLDCHHVYNRPAFMLGVESQDTTHAKKDRKTERQTDRQTPSQPASQTDRPTDRQTDRQTPSQADRQTERKRWIDAGPEDWFHIQDVPPAGVASTPYQRRPPSRTVEGSICRIFWNGLQARSDGLQPTSDGLQPGERWPPTY